ncbi:MAG: inositol monophosphatase [Pirellulaceae bacterium]|nr:MAG: inositol monophosphatase [Pirellulaceae bacterium]
MCTYEQWAERAEQAARAAGVILRRMQPTITAREKAPKDLVSEADWESQRAIRQLLAAHYPDYGFLGEESPGGKQQKLPPGYVWIVDPLDGTSNYVHGVPSYAVSIALWCDHQPLVGVVLDPVLDECFVAIRGHGARLNGRPIAPSRCRALRDALVAASLGPQVPRGSVEVARLVEAIHEAQGVRRTGSAALNLCYVACGRFDGYWATSVSLWDVAAGLLLVEEAGGCVTNLHGGAFRYWQPEVLVSASQELHTQLLEMLRRAEGTLSPSGPAVS